MEKEIGNYKIEVVPDENPESPRTWDNLGKMVCFHSHYNLGDKHDFSDPPEFSEFLEHNRKNLIILPLYLYDHSGITMNTTGFSCPWDSGKVGYIYVEKSKVRQEYNWKALTKKRIEKIKEYLKGEVKTFDQYITGDVYGYRITKDDEEVDSCWGFYGENECMAEAESMVNALMNQ